MKRRAPDDEKTRDIVALPCELWAHMVVEAGLLCPALVSRAWARAFHETDWLAVLCSRADQWRDTVLHFTGSGFTADTPHTMTVGEYVAELEERFTYAHLLYGLRHRLSYFVLYGLSVFLEGPRQPDWTPVNRTCLMQSALYYLRDVAEKPLAARHFHPRDFRINFFEEGHTYLLAMRQAERWVLATNIDSAVPGIMSRELTSTTAMNDELFQIFDEDGVAHSLANSTHPDYRDLTAEQIKASWAEARQLGTAWHFNLESLCNGLRYELDSREGELFQGVEQEHFLGRLVPYRTEWLIYDEALRQTGSVDILFTALEQPLRLQDGRLPLVMADWKRANKLLKPNMYQRGKAPCTADMEDSKISHYRIQLLNYAGILQRLYGVTVTERSVIGMHPTQEQYIKYDVEWEEARVAALIAHRRQWLADREEARKLSPC